MQTRVLKKSSADLWKHKKYIQECCPLVSDVHSSSIYFKDHASWYLALPWNFADGKHEEMEIMVKQLNGLLGTNFVWEPEDD